MKYRIDVEEMPDEVEANNLADALRMAINEIGVYPVEDEVSDKLMENE